MIKTYLLNLMFLLVVATITANAQNCPLSATSTILTNPNTYYPGVSATVAAGATSITLGAAGAGTTPIATGDLLLVIQMQGAQINNTNSNSYGDGVSGGASSGYLNNAALQAGYMEYIVATNAVPLAGGTLTLLTGTVNTYKNAAYGTDGQYKYQVIRVGLYYNLVLAASITAPNWNGSTGGVVVISVTNNLNFNGQQISAAAAGFRGGAARKLSGGMGGSNADIVTLSSQNYNGSKGEGLAGTPRYINNHSTFLDNVSEGYPNGSYAAGAPGNAGGGGTDGNPTVNDQNSGGGGGANGGAGGRGGNTWSSNLTTGGEPGAVFAQNSAARMVMGGGGGAGTTNNGTGSLGAGFSTSGATGGGIVLLTAASISGSGTIDVSGESGFITVLNDGSGGGGAGGSALVFAGSGLSNVTVLANGGTGGTNTGLGSPHGPGGGGGGGIVFSNGALNAATSVTGGGAGYTALGSTHYNATAGSNGILVQNITRSQVPNQFLNCSLLPVNFTGVSALWQQNNVVVKWEVSNADAVKSYTIEKSADGINFTEAGTVTNTNSFTDTKNTNAGNTYYRIKETGVANDITYSTTVIVKAQTVSGTGFSVSPNPAIGNTASIHFKVNTPGGAPVMLRMVSLNGVTVWQQLYKAVSGVNTVTIDNLAAFPNGTYFIQFTGNQVSMNTKLIVQH